MKIKFETHLDFYENDIKNLISPIPIKKNLPDWYVNFTVPEIPKKSEDYLFDSFIKKRKIIKNCMPVADYLQSGYMIPAWEDMFFYKDSDGILKLRTTIDSYLPPEQRDSNHSYHNVKQFYDFSKTNIFSEYYGERNIVKDENFNIIKLLNPWSIITPPGYSTLFMRPFYHDQKINILPAIVDTDSFNSKINFPFFLNINIEETYRISLGDPLIMIFPFKRDSWKSDIKFNAIQKPDGFTTKINNYYKNFIRKIKKYD